MLDPLALSGRVAIVTGASRGIGRAIAETLAAHGATLILNGRRDGEAISRASRYISEKFNVPVSYVAGDISQAQTSANLVKDAFTRHKRLDIYVNNAGVLIDGLIGMMPEHDIDATLSINLAGVLHGVQSAARLMQRGGRGSIINMSSIIGRFGNTGQLVYSASKAGVIGATLAAAKELAPKNIRVNAIAPGFIDTDMVRQIPEAKFAERLASIGMGRIGTPQDIANTALFLASDLSSYVTGQVLGVDGGMLV
jgi:3-oxoacyl-[acyl-carrier protein] reductase